MGSRFPVSRSAWPRIIGSWPWRCTTRTIRTPTTRRSTCTWKTPEYFPRTDILWASPECTKWSQANGSKTLPAIEQGLFEDPLSDEASQRSRLLMFDVLRFAEHHQYRAMIVENVVDVATQAKYRTAWHLWRHELATLGYRHRVVSLNSMHAQAGGLPAPQSRDRIYIVCWRDGDTAPDLDRVLRPSAWCPKCSEVVESSQAWKNGRTLTAEGNNDYLLSPYCCGRESAKPISEPVGTLTTRDRYALIQRHNSSRGDGAGMITPASEYLGTLTTKGHQSLVTPGDLEAAEAQVDDCLFRMLEPREVAAGMAFPADYQWSGNRRERVRLAGNAVTPPAARDLIGAIADTLVA